MDQGPKYGAMGVRAHSSFTGDLRMLDLTERSRGKRILWKNEVAGGKKYAKKLPATTTKVTHISRARLKTGALCPKLTAPFFICLVEMNFVRI